MAAAMALAEQARAASDQIAARERGAALHRKAAQRRFELAIDREVGGSVESIYRKRCEPVIKEAITANQRSATIDIPTYYGDEEPIPPNPWWQPGARCRATIRHLQAYLRTEGFEISEGERYFNRHPRDASATCIGYHCIPLTLSW